MNSTKKTAYDNKKTNVIISSFENNRQYLINTRYVIVAIYQLVSVVCVFLSVLMSKIVGGVYPFVIVVATLTILWVWFLTHQPNI